MNCKYIPPNHSLYFHPLHRVSHKHFKFWWNMINFTFRNCAFGSLMFNIFEESLYIFSVVAAPIYTPTNSAWRFLFLHILAILVICCLFENSQFDAETWPVCTGAELNLRDRVLGVVGKKKIALLLCQAKGDTVGLCPENCVSQFRGIKWGVL